MTETSLQNETIAGRTLGRAARYIVGYAILIAVMLVSPLFVFLPAALFHCIIRNGRRITWTSLFIGTGLAGARVQALKFVSIYQKAGIPNDAIGFLRKWMEIGVYCLPAFLLIDVILVFVLSLVLFARLRLWREMMERRQTAFNSPYLFRNLSLPEWLLFAFIIGGLSPLASGIPQRIGANVLALVTFLYLLQ